MQLFSWLFLLCVAFYLLLHDEKFGSDSQKHKADKWVDEKLYNIKRVRLCLWIANPIIQRPRHEVTYLVQCTSPCFLNLRFHFIFHQGQSLQMLSAFLKPGVFTAFVQKTLCYMMLIWSWVYQYKWHPNKPGSLYSNILTICCNNSKWSLKAACNHNLHLYSVIASIL